MEKEAIIYELKSGNYDPLARWLDTINEKEELLPSDDALMDEATKTLIKLLDDEKRLRLPSGASILLGPLGYWGCNRLSHKSQSPQPSLCFSLQRKKSYFPP